MKRFLKFLYEGLPHTEGNNRFDKEWEWSPRNFARIYMGTLWRKDEVARLHGYYFSERWTLSFDLGETILNKTYVGPKNGTQDEASDPNNWKMTTRWKIGKRSHGWFDVMAWYGKFSIRFKPCIFYFDWYGRNVTWHIRCDTDGRSR